MPPGYGLLRLSFFFGLLFYFPLVSVVWFDSCRRLRRRSAIIGGPRKVGCRSGAPWANRWARAKGTCGGRKLDSWSVLHGEKNVLAGALQHRVASAAR